MILKMTYELNGTAENIEINCSNYTFGLPVLFGKFSEKHGKSYDELVKSGEASNVEISSFYNDEWHVLSRAYVKVKNKEVEFYNAEGRK